MKYKFLISHMTLEEKASLMSGKDAWFTKALPAHGVPSMRLSDGPHGLRVTTEGQNDMIAQGGSKEATCLPTASALANSWDTEILQKAGELLGTEAAAENVGVLLGPGICIKRNPLCGRSFEYFSEDPFLSAKLGAAMIRGIQSKGVLACAKHFAANSQETLRMSSDSVIDERTLREIYLPSFEAAVKEANVGCIMTSYNKINGVYANENEHTLRDILYKEWKYDGMVVSDWGGNNDRVAALKVGSTLEMPACHGITDRQIVDAVKAGELDESILDEQVDTLLAAIFTTAHSLSAAPKRYDRYKHHLISADIAAETAVLLKNEDDVLPLDGSKSVGVIGEYALNPRFQGEGSSMVNAWNPQSPLECFKKAGIRVCGSAAGYERKDKRNKALLKEAVELASAVDVVILYLGLAEEGEGEGRDRETLKLPKNQLRVLEAVSSVNSNVIVILSCGSVVDTSWDFSCKALVHGFLSGQAGALAMAELITGKRNFSGKLAETYPIAYEDEPSAPYYPGKELTAEYREGIYVGYRYFTTAGVPVKYPFGFGLSYTSFEYSDLTADKEKATFKIKNIGAFPGDEIAQLYVSAHTGGVFRAEKELKGFARVHLEAGEEREVTIPLNDRSFAFWSVSDNKWLVEPGSYDILIGASVEDIRLGAGIVIEGEPVRNPYKDELFTAYLTGEAHSVSDGAFSALLGRKIPPSEWNRNIALGENDTVLQGMYLSGGMGKLLYIALIALQSLRSLKGDVTGANNINFILNCTYRGVVRRLGLKTDRSVNAFMSLVNGKNDAAKELLTYKLHNTSE